MNLTLFLLFPLFTALAILFAQNLKQIRSIALAGSLLQLGLAVKLLLAFNAERAAGNPAQMLFEYVQDWYAPLHLQYHIGVDGISIAMILLTSFIVVAGILVSWSMETLSKEFFFLLILLSLGAYGFFISLDIFTMFFFLEVAVIPKFLLIGIRGSGKKEYSAMKLALMLMGGSALIMVGIFGIYFSSHTTSGAHTFDILLLSKMDIPLSSFIFVTRFLAPTFLKELLNAINCSDLFILSMITRYLKG